MNDKLHRVAYSLVPALLVGALGTGLVDGFGVWASWPIAFMASLLGIEVQMHEMNQRGFWTWNKEE